MKPVSSPEMNMKKNSQRKSIKPFHRKFPKDKKLKTTNLPKSKLSLKQNKDSKTLKKHLSEFVSSALCPE
jgi:hypothetical protein